MAISGGAAGGRERIMYVRTAGRKCINSIERKMTAHFGDDNRTKGKQNPYIKNRRIYNEKRINI